MGNCEYSMVSRSFQHPILGECWEFQQDNLIKIVQINPDERQMERWEKIFSEAEQVTPQLRDFAYVPVKHVGDLRGSGKKFREFWFQSYLSTLAEKLETIPPKSSLPEQQIRKVGKKLFQLYHAYPTIPHHLQLHHILISEQQNIRIVLPHLLPPCQNISLHPPSGLKCSTCSQQTQHSVGQPKKVQINTLSDIYSILLRLTKQGRVYSSQLIYMMGLMGKDGNTEMIGNFFLEVESKPMHNYLLDTGSDSITTNSDVTSLFFLTETSFNCDI